MPTEAVLQLRLRVAWRLWLSYGRPGRAHSAWRELVWAAQALELAQLPEPGPDQVEVEVERMFQG